jgi:hypothetical protein
MRYSSSNLVETPILEMSEMGFTYKTIHAGKHIQNLILRNPLLLFTGLRYQRNCDIRERSKVTNIEETQGYQHNWRKYVGGLEKVGNPL